MGVIAFVRQAFLDAQHYGVERRRSARSGRSRRSRRCSRRSTARCRSRSRRTRAREILRALKMAKELKLDPIVTGARQAEGRRPPISKSQNVRVIYSLNYPVRPRALAPDADEPLERAARPRRRAEGPRRRWPRPASRSRSRPRGSTDPKDFVKNAAKAVKAGSAGRCRDPRADDQRRDHRRRRRSPRIDRERQGREPGRDRRRSVRREDDDQARLRRGPAGRPRSACGPSRTGPRPRTTLEHFGSV